MVDISGAFMQADAIATPWENGWIVNTTLYIEQVQVVKGIPVVVWEFTKGSAQDLDGKAPTPAANHLFAINENDPILNEKEVQRFHFQSCCYFAKDRHQIFKQQSHSSQETRSRWLKKLSHVIKYLRWTPQLVLILNASQASEIIWYAESHWLSHVKNNSKKWSRRRWHSKKVFHVTWQLIFCIKSLRTNFRPNPAIKERLKKIMNRQLVDSRFNYLTRNYCLISEPFRISLTFNDCLYTFGY